MLEIGVPPFQNTGRYVRLVGAQRGNSRVYGERTGVVDKVLEHLLGEIYKRLYGRWLRVVSWCLLEDHSQRLHRDTKQSVLRANFSHGFHGIAAKWTDADFSGPHLGDLKYGAGLVVGDVTQQLPGYVATYCPTKIDGASEPFGEGDLAR